MSAPDSTSFRFRSGMSGTTQLRDVVLRSRRRLNDGREKIRQQHESGSLGIQVSTRLADLYDDIVLDVWGESTKDLGDDERC